MFTISDLIRQAREVLQDVGSVDVGGSSVTVQTRHSDAKLVGYMNQAFAQAKRLRPDLFLADVSTSPPAYADTPTPFFTAADIALPTPPDFPLDDTYYTCFVEYVAGFAGLGDDEFAQDGRAAGLILRFERTLTGSVAGT